MLSRNSSSISFLAGGDVALNRPRSRHAFGHLNTLFQDADVAFANLELPLSLNGQPAIGKNIIRGKPKMIEALTEARFDVLSFANNHALDYGEEAFFETLDSLKERGIPVVGAGEHLAGARKAVILERNGFRIGVLAYCSVLPRGFSAGLRTLPPDANPLQAYKSAGVNPLRASTAYRPPEGTEEYPGRIPEVLTWAHSGDLKRMRSDIRKLRAKVDALIVNHHWGTSMVHEVRAFQREISHAAVDAGADVVLGGHPHVLQGVEFYKEKPIVYSMGNLIFDFDVPFFTVASKQNILFGCTLTKGGIRNAYLLPCWSIMKKPPFLLSPIRGRGREIFHLIQHLSKEFGTQMKVVGQQILLYPA